MYDQSTIRNTIENYYIDLYSDPIPVRPMLEGVEWDTLEDEQSNELERPFSSKKSCLLSTI